MQSAGLVMFPSVVISYALDTYPTLSGDVLTLINAIKNCIAFGLTKGLNSWFAREGLKKMFVEMAAIQWAVLALPLRLYFMSPWLRRKTLIFL